MMAVRIVNGTGPIDAVVRQCSNSVPDAGSVRMLPLDPHADLVAPGRSRHAGGVAMPAMETFGEASRTSTTKREERPPRRECSSPPWIRPAMASLPASDDGTIGTNVDLGPMSKASNHGFGT